MGLKTTAFKSKEDLDVFGHKKGIFKGFTVNKQFQYFIQLILKHNDHNKNSQQNKKTPNTIFTHMVMHLQDWRLLLHHGRGGGGRSGSTHCRLFGSRWLRVPVQSKSAVPMCLCAREFLSGSIIALSYACSSFFMSHC